MLYHAFNIILNGAQRSEGSQRMFGCKDRGCLMSTMNGKSYLSLMIGRFLRFICVFYCPPEQSTAE